MDAKTVLEMMERGIYPEHNSEFWKTCRDALRLLAAAEANDGTEAKVLPSFIAEQLCSDYSRGKCGDPSYDDCSCQRLVRGYEQINNERNGLAARVAELLNKAILYDLDAAGIETRTEEAVELVELRARARELEPDAERLKFQHSNYVKSCNAGGLHGAMPYSEWIAALDAARSK